MTRSRFCAGPFRSRELRFGRLPRSCEVPPKRRCHFRTTARNSPTASRHCSRGLSGGVGNECDRPQRRAFRVAGIKRRGRVPCHGSGAGLSRRAIERFQRGSRPAAGSRLKEQSGDGWRDCCSVTDGAIRQPGGGLPLLVHGSRLRRGHGCGSLRAARRPQWLRLTSMSRPPRERTAAARRGSPVG
jgi:hypothetical protein